MSPPILPDDPIQRRQRALTRAVALITATICAVFAIVLGVFMYYNALRWNALLPLDVYQVGPDGALEHKPLEELRLRLVLDYQNFERHAAQLDEEDVDRRLADIDAMRTRYRVEHAALVNAFLLRQSAMKVGAIMLLIAFAGLVLAIVVAHRSWPEQPDPDRLPSHGMGFRTQHEMRYALLAVLVLVIVTGWWLGRAGSPSLPGDRDSYGQKDQQDQEIDGPAQDP